MSVLRKINISPTFCVNVCFIKAVLLEHKYQGGLGILFKSHLKTGTFLRGAAPTIHIELVWCLRRGVSFPGAVPVDVVKTVSAQNCTCTPNICFVLFVFCHNFGAVY